MICGIDTSLECRLTIGQMLATLPCDASEVRVVIGRQASDTLRRRGQILLVIAVDRFDYRKNENEDCSNLHSLLLSLVRMNSGC